jgi:hypothetical protein
VSLNSLLANMRLLCLPSENLGQDWFEKGQQIDSVLTDQGMDLSEESVYLLYSDSPSEVLDGNGQCLVARPVIGPKKSFEEPLKLIDWKAAPVWLESLQGHTWVEILESTEEARAKAVKGGRDFAKPFILRVRRSLKTELILTVEGIFHE